MFTKLKTNIIILYMEDLNLKCYAHLGDAVYELFVREKIILLTTNMARMHKIKKSLVRASFQFELLNVIGSYLTETEKDLIRTRRNLPQNSSRKHNQSLHRIATGFEVLIGYLHLNDRERLLYIFKLISDYIDSKDHIVIE